MVNLKFTLPDLPCKLLTFPKRGMSEDMGQKIGLLTASQRRRTEVAEINLLAPELLFFF